MGTTTIDTSITSQRNIVLISGGNDRGKTTLLTAIKFALFGEQQDIQAAKMVNYQQAKLDNGSMHVEIVFEHNAREYRLRRSVKFRQVRTNSEVPTIAVSKPSIFEDGHNTKLDQTWLDHLLPMDVSQFFIFDGEQIRDYIDRAATSLKEPIEIILGIRELLNARDDLREILSELDKEHQDELATQTRKQKVFKQYREILQEHKASIKMLELSIKEAKSNEKKLTKDLNSHDKLNELNEKTRRITHSISQLENGQENYIKKVAEQRSNFGLFLIRPLLQMVGETESLVIEEWESVAAHNVLEKQRCLCGRSLDAESIKLLNAKLSKTTAAQHRLYKIASKILSKQDLDARMIDLADAQHDLQHNHDNINRLHDELHDTQLVIESTTDREFDYDHTIKNLREAQGNIKRWEEEMLHHSTSTDKVNKKIKNFKKELKLGANSTNLKNIEMRLEMTKRLINAVNFVINSFYEKRKPALEKMISDVFIKLTNNPDHYRGLEIENDFSVRIVREDGSSRPTTQYSPSAGASQIVATAIISGLNNFATRDAPIIIDTPLGRLDPTHKMNVIRHYSQMGRQVIVLYQQSEMNDQDIQIINNNIASEWKITSILDQAGISKVSLVRSNL